MRTPARLLLIGPVLASLAGAQAVTTLYVHGNLQCLRYGTQCLGLGDVNNDGYGDFAVGAPEAPFVQAISGRNGLPLWQANGAGGSNFGEVLRLGSDRDQDGLADVLVGAPTWSGGAGMVQVLSARTGSPLGLITGSTGDGLGNDVADIGDLDGDGRADLLVGAMSYPNNQNWGKAIVVSGANYTTVLAQINGAAANGRLGRAVLAAGDIDNDAVPDFLVSETGQSVVRAYSGRFRSLLYTLTGSSELGAHLLRCGDLNADGNEDLLVHAAAQGNGNVLAYTLRTGAPLFMIPGGGGFGHGLVAMGDLDNDGGIDFAVSLPGGSNGGAVEVFSGRTRASLYLIVEGGGWYGARFGTGLGSADVDADGRLDLVVGSPGFCFQGNPRDQSVKTIALRKWTLSTDGHTVSLANGGVVSHRIDAGAAHAGSLYFVVGTWSDTRPGFDFAGHHVPLNPDAYFQFTASNFNTPVLPNSLGLLDGAGVGTCGFQIPPLLPPVFLGLRADHAAVLFCATPLFSCVRLVTNARPVTIVQ